MSVALTFLLDVTNAADRVRAIRRGQRPPRERGLGRDVRDVVLILAFFAIPFVAFAFADSVTYAIVVWFWGAALNGFAWADTVTALRLRTTIEAVRTLERFTRSEMLLAFAFGGVVMALGGAVFVGVDVALGESVASAVFGLGCVLGVILGIDVVLQRRIKKFSD